MVTAAADFYSFANNTSVKMIAVCSDEPQDVSPSLLPRLGTERGARVAHCGRYPPPLPYAEMSVSNMLAG